jgi:tetratricopeptide (TPR) repeat protein
MGKVQEALPALEEAWEIRVKKEKRLQNKVELTEARIEAAILQGALDRALAESETLLDETSKGESKSSYQQALLHRLDALLHAGHLKEAQRIARLVKDSDFTDENPVLRALAKARLSQFEAAMGNFAESESLLKEATAPKCLDIESHAQALLRLGEAMFRGNKKQKAASYLDRAKKLFASLVKNGYRTRELDMTKELLAKL